MEFTISNIVSDVTLSSEINLDSLFQHIEIHKISKKTIEDLMKKEQKSRKKKTVEPELPKKVPFFGTNGVCISFRYKKKSKGYRPELKKTSAFADGDIQYAGKNYHFKISKKRINLLGVKEYKLLPEIYDVIIKIINDSERNRKDGLPIFVGEEELQHTSLKINNVLVNGTFFTNEENKYSLTKLSKGLKDSISSDNISVEFDNNIKKEITVKFFKDDQSMGKCIIKSNGKTTFTLKLEEKELVSIISFMYNSVSKLL